MTAEEPNAMTDAQRELADRTISLRRNTPPMEGRRHDHSAEAAHFRAETSDRSNGKARKRGFPDGANGCKWGMFTSRTVSVRTEASCSAASVSVPWDKLERSASLNAEV